MIGVLFSCGGANAIANSGSAAGGVVRGVHDVPSMVVEGTATHYSQSYEGQPLACGGVYHSDDPSIVAVAYPSRQQDWPCGYPFWICGEAGCIKGLRQDSCPGCSANMVDLSEAGLAAICPGADVCPVYIFW